MNSETPQVDELVHRITNNPGVTWSHSEICEMIELAMRLELRNKRLVEALCRVTHDVEELLKLADDCIIYDGDTWSCRSCGMELDSGISHSSHCLVSRITDFGAVIHVAEKALADQQEEKR